MKTVAAKAIMSPSRITILAAIAVGFAEAAVRHSARIEPELEPKSDKKFFGEDYSWDKRPGVDRHFTFDHPYPAVQDTSDFDKDYVKDENADGGKWKAQMEYDILRSKIREAEKDLKKAKDKLDEEEKEWIDAKDKYGKHQKESDDAEAARKQAEKEAQEAEDRVNKLGGGHGEKDDGKAGGSVGEAVRKVNKEMDDLEGCKKELAEAKEKLKKLMKEKEELEKMNKEQKAKYEEEKAKQEKEEKEEEAKHEKEKTKAEKERSMKDGEREEAEKDVEKKTAAESSWKSKIEEEKKEHAEASKTYEEELKDVERTEAQLKAAEKNLRKFRRAPYVDDNGGVYNVPDEHEHGKSSARSSSAAAAALLAAVVAFAL